MKNNSEKLTHNEKTQAIADCLRDIMSVEISNRNMPNLLMRGKAISALITADHREELMESKRNAVTTIMLNGEARVTKKLKRMEKK